MKISFRYLVPLLLFMGMVFFLFRGLSIDPKRIPSPLIDKPIPEFSIRTLEDGSKMISSEDLKGQVSLVNVWATWCVSCRAEHEVLKELARANIAPIYGISYKDEEVDAKRWLSSLGNPYVANAFDYDGKLAINWGVYGTPETFLIDKKGIIRYKHIGPVGYSDLSQTIIPKIRELQAEL